MIEFALRYAQAGLKVIPLKPRGKLPLTEHGAHDATTDEAQIKAWWAKWPDANIGMTLTGLVVIDIDPRNGGAPHSLPHVLPDTCIAYTGGGGSHFLYVANPNARYSGHPAQGIDVKTGPGAYIVVEPSIHESGNKYCWIDESEPWGQKPAEAPSWLEQHVSSAPAVSGERIPSGRRNEALTAMAGAMRRRGAAQGSIEAALFEENKRCVPPLDDEEVRRIAASVARYAPSTPAAAEDSIPSIVTPNSVIGDLVRIHRDGLGKGDLLGWPSLDKLFSVATGQITTITGWPNSGKSQWTDALALNLARQGWRFVFCSLENIPIVLHVEKLAKQLVGKPLREGPTERMSISEIEKATREMDEWFSFVLPSEKKPNPSVTDVLETIEAEFRRRGLWGVKDAKLACVIDPWNELEHVRPQGLSLTEYVGESLSRLRQWSRRNMLHVFIVGHPAKQQRNRESGKLPVATPDMISDSAHFWNKSDNCITVALTNEHKSQEVDIHIQKIRFAHIGTRGVATLNYDKTTGRYHEPFSEPLRAVRDGRGRGIDF